MEVSAKNTSADAPAFAAKAASLVHLASTPVGVYAVAEAGQPTHRFAHTPALDQTMFSI